MKKEVVSSQYIQEIRDKSQSPYSLATQTCRSPEAGSTLDTKSTEDEEPPLSLPGTRTFSDAATVVDVESAS